MGSSSGCSCASDPSSRTPASIGQPRPGSLQLPLRHTLHAVSFTWQAGAHFPELLWVSVLLAALIGASRVVLGLQLPTLDVLAGA